MCGIVIVFYCFLMGLSHVCLFIIIYTVNLNLNFQVEHMFFKFTFKTKKWCWRRTNLIFDRIFNFRSRFLYIWNLDNRQLIQVIELPDKVKVVKEIQFVTNSMALNQHQVFFFLCVCCFWSMVTFTYFQFEKPKICFMSLSNCFVPSQHYHGMDDVA